MELNSKSNVFQNRGRALKEEEMLMSKQEFETISIFTLPSTEDPHQEEVTWNKYLENFIRASKSEEQGRFSIDLERIRGSYPVFYPATVVLPSLEEIVGALDKGYHPEYPPEGITKEFESILRLFYVNDSYSLTPALVYRYLEKMGRIPCRYSADDLATVIWDEIYETFNMKDARRSFKEKFPELYITAYVPAPHF